MCPPSGLWYRLSVVYTLVLVLEVCRPFFCTLVPGLGVQGASAKTTSWKPSFCKPLNLRISDSQDALKVEVARLQIEVGTKSFFFVLNFHAKNAPKCSPFFWAFAKNFPATTQKNHRRAFAGAQGDSPYRLWGQKLADFYKHGLKFENLPCHAHCSHEGLDCVLPSAAKSSQFAR